MFNWDLSSTLMEWRLKNANSNVRSSTESHCLETRGNDLKSRNFVQSEDSGLFLGVPLPMGGCRIGAACGSFPRNYFGEGSQQVGDAGRVWRIRCQIWRFQLKKPGWNSSRTRHKIGSWGLVERPFGWRNLWFEWMLLQIYINIYKPNIFKGFKTPRFEFLWCWLALLL